MSQEYDPITLEIIQNSLQAAADEMFAALRHTAMSEPQTQGFDRGESAAAFAYSCSNGPGVGERRTIQIDVERDERHARTDGRRASRGVRSCRTKVRPPVR